MNPMERMTANNTPMEQLMNALQSGANPYQLYQDALNQNPQAKKMLNSMQQQCGAGNPMHYVIGMFRNVGIDKNQVIQLANAMGLR